MKQYFQNLLRILNDSLTSIDESVFEQLVKDSSDTLKRGNKVIVSGLGKNVPVCDKFVGTMNSFGLNAQYMNTNSAVHGDLGMIHRGDLVIILTKSGETAESIYLNKLIMKRECTRWLITFEKESTLVREMPKALIISLEHEGDLWNIAPNNSTTLNLIVLQMLAVRLSAEMNVDLKEFKANHPGGHIGELLKNE